MNESMQWKVIGCFVLAMLGSLSADALEIRVQRECQIAGSLVRLGDVANVFDSKPDKAEAVARIALFPSPARTRILTSQELKRLLQLNGVKLTECRFTGATSTRLSKTTGTSAAKKAPTITAVKRAQKRLEHAIADYLHESADSSADWEVRTSPSRQQLQLVSNERNELSISGGRDPWLGRQQFVATVTTPQGAKRFSAAADVSQKSMVVVARRPLRRGETIRSADVELKPAPENTTRNLFFRVQDVVGMETLRSVRAGQPLEDRAVQPPIVIRRGEIVTAVAIASGVRVRTTAHAMEDGRRGDLILVQTPDKKQKYAARVTDYQTVEVFASGRRVTR